VASLGSRNHREGEIRVKEREKRSERKPHEEGGVLAAENGGERNHEPEALKYV